MARRRKSRGRRKSPKSYKTRKLKVASGRSPGRIGFRLS